MHRLSPIWFSSWCLGVDVYSTSFTNTGDLCILEFRFSVVYHISLCGTDIVFCLFGWRGLNTWQACQLFRSARDMRRRRLAQLPIHDLDITMKTDKSFLPPPAQSLQGCLNSRPGSHPPFTTNVSSQFFFQPFYSVYSQLMMSYSSRITQMQTTYWSFQTDDCGTLRSLEWWLRSSKSFWLKLHFHIA